MPRADNDFGHDDFGHDDFGDDVGGDDVGGDDVGGDDVGGDDVGGDDVGGDDAGGDDVGGDDAGGDDAGGDDAGGDDAGGDDAGGDDADGDDVGGDDAGGDDDIGDDVLVDDDSADTEDKETAEDNENPDTSVPTDDTSNDATPSNQLVLAGGDVTQVGSGSSQDLVETAMDECSLSEQGEQGVMLLVDLNKSGEKTFTSYKDPATGLTVSEATDGSACRIGNANGDGVAAYGSECKAQPSKDPGSGAITLAAGGKDESGNANAVCVRIDTNGTKTVQGVTVDGTTGEVAKSEARTFGPDQAIDNRSAGLDSFFPKDADGKAPVAVGFQGRTNTGDTDKSEKKSTPTTGAPTPSKDEQPPTVLSPKAPETTPDSTQTPDPKAPPSKTPEDPKSPTSPADPRDIPESGDTTPQPESPSQSSPSPESQPTPGQGAPSPDGGPGLDDLIPFLDAIGFFPGPVGYAAQASLAGIYLYQGKYSEALTAGIGAIPIAGVLSKLQKVGNTVKAVDKAAKHKKFLEKLAISQKGPVKSEASANQALAKMARKNVSKTFSSKKKTKDDAQHSKGKSQQMRGRKKNKKEAHGKTKPGKDAFDTKKGGHYHDKDHTNDPDYKAHKKNVHYRWY